MNPSEFVYFSRSRIPRSSVIPCVFARVKQSSIYRGQVKSVADNNVTFYRTPDIGNPGNLIGPLPAGVLRSQQAKAVAQLDENGSVSSINLIYPGSGYLDKPNVYLTPSQFANYRNGCFRTAMAEVVWDANGSLISGITVIEKGRGYKDHAIGYY